MRAAALGQREPGVRSSKARRRLRLPDVAALVVFGLAGLMFAASGHGVARPQRADVSGGLTAAIAAKQEHNAAMSDTLAHLRAELITARGAVDPSQQLADASQQIDELAPDVGLTQLSGPGVTVTLQDAPSPDPLPKDLTPDDFIVHQQDIQAVVNALWRGGATGISVMGQRLISTSAVRCVGNTVILDGRVYSPPFVVSAVGPVQNLVRSLRADDSVIAYRSWAEVVGLGYEQRTGNLRLPEYNGPLPPSGARGTGPTPRRSAGPAPRASGSDGSAVPTPGESTG